MKSANDKAKHPTDTAQATVWTGNFGRDYTDRNTFDLEGLDQLYLSHYGVARSEINRNFLSDLPKDLSFLEVGCNAGNQLLLLRQMGWSNLSAVELQPYAIEAACARVPEATIKQGSALDIPWADSSFDVVFTSGVLIHIAPHDLPRALDEIHRVSRKYIWGLEYYAPQTTEINYRGNDDLLWKTDHVRLFLERFPDLELVKEQRLPYLNNDNVDSVFLLRKKS